MKSTKEDVTLSYSDMFINKYTRPLISTMETSSLTRKLNWIQPAWSNLNLNWFAFNKTQVDKGNLYEECYLQTNKNVACQQHTQGSPSCGQPPKLWLN